MAQHKLPSNLFSGSAFSVPVFFQTQNEPFVFLNIHPPILLFFFLIYALREGILYRIFVLQHFN